MSEFEANSLPERKRVKVASVNEQLETLMMKWIKDANTRCISLSGPLIQQKALKFAADLSMSDYKVSNRWLEKFLKRNNLTCKKMSGERGDVKTEVVKDWEDKIVHLYEGYEPRDIFNMDETGIFFKAGKRTFVKSGSDCAGGKCAKDRITVLLCASMTGEKLKPLVIGKSGNSRCFKNVKRESLPVKYKANKKSWMNSTVFEDWANVLTER